MIGTGVKWSVSQRHIYIIHHVHNKIDTTNNNKCGLYNIHQASENLIHRNDEVATNLECNNLMIERIHI